MGGAEWWGGAAWRGSSNGGRVGKAGWEGPRDQMEEDGLGACWGP